MGAPRKGKSPIRQLHERPWLPSQRIKRAFFSFLRRLCRGHREGQQPQGSTKKLDSPGSWVCRSFAEERCLFLHASRVSGHCHKMHGAILLALFGCPKKNLSQERAGPAGHLWPKQVGWQLCGGGEKWLQSESGSKASRAGEEERGLFWAGGWLA